MLDPQATGQRWVVEISDVSSRVNLRVTSAEEFIHHYSIFDTQATLLCERDIRFDAQPCDDCINQQLATTFGLKQQLLTSFYNSREPFS